VTGQTTALAGDQTEMRFMIERRELACPCGERRRAPVDTATLSFALIHTVTFRALALSVLAAEESEYGSDQFGVLGV